MLKTNEHVIMTVSDFQSIICGLQQLEEKYSDKAEDAKNVEIQRKFDGMACAFWQTSETLAMKLMEATEVEEGGFILDAAINAVVE